MIQIAGKQCNCYDNNCCAAKNFYILQNRQLKIRLLLALKTVSFDLKLFSQITNFFVRTT